ncbi:MAG: type II toxin-antitoxin system HipA family toxin [Bacteroidia bacterium]
MVDVAEIKIWGQFVGAVRWEPERNFGVFQYDKNFLSKRIELAPLKMPLADGQKLHAFPELRPKNLAELNTFKGLPGMLADSLPDRFGRDLINAWLTGNGRTQDSMNPVELLCFIGRRAMGALEFEPAKQNSTSGSQAIEIQSLVDTASSILNKKKGFTTNLDADKRQAMIEVLKVGTSAGGARPKAVIAYNESSGEVRSGQSSAPEGFSHWLLKLDGVSKTQFGESYGYGRVEMSYYLMAKDCGIDMMECRLLEENGRAHFMTKRFDREGSSTKHHVQTLCAMQHFDFNQVNSYSYEQLFQTMRMLKLDYPQAEQMFRRMVFNVYAVNCDDHTKNFSFILKQNSTWRLAPAYDVCFSYDPKSIWVSQHALSILGKRKEIADEDLLEMAYRNNIRKPDEILAQIKDVVSRWDEYASQTSVDEKLKNHIFQVLKTQSPLAALR